MFLQAVFLGVCWLSCTSSIPIIEDLPDIVARTTPEALTYASELGAKYYLADHIRQSLTYMNVMEVCIFGSCYLQYRDVDNYIPPKSNVTFIPGKGIGWTLLEAKFNLCFYFQLKDTEADEATYVRGRACVRLSGMLLDAVLALEKGSDGRLNISLTKCLVDLRVIDSNVSITEKSGNSSKFQGLFDGNKTELHDYLQNRLNASVSTAMYNMADLVARMIPDGVRQMKTELARAGLTLNDTLVKPLIIEQTIIEIAFRFTFGTVSNEVGPSIPPHDLLLPPLNSSMVGLYMSDRVVNTMLDAIFKIKMLSVNITKDSGIPMIFQYYRNIFNISCDDPFCFPTIFPNITEKYSNISEKNPNATAKFVITATSRPSVNFTSKALSLQGEIVLSIVFPEEDGSEVTVAKLRMFVSMSAGCSFLVLRDRVAAVLSDPSIKITDKGSPKEFASYAPLLESYLQTMVDSVVSSVFNLYGALGYPLFLQYYGIRLVNTDLGFGTGDVHFSSNINHDSRPPDVSDSALYYLYLVALSALLA